MQRSREGGPLDAVKDEVEGSGCGGRNSGCGSCLVERAEPCGWLFGCRTVAEAEAARRNPVDGRIFIRFGPFVDRASIEAPAAQIRTRLEDVGYEFVCTRDFGSRPELNHLFRDPTDTFTISIIDSGEMEGSVDLRLIGKAEPERVTFSCEESP